jgi:hypothetical protein
MSELTDIAHALRGTDDRRLIAVLALLDRLPAREAVDALLDSVRPRLWLLRPPRRLSLRRLMALPLEPLLAESELCPGGGIRLPRSVLAALFAVVEPRLDAVLVAELRDETNAATTADIDSVLRAGRRLWPAAAAALHQAFRDPRGTTRMLAAGGFDAVAISEHYPAMLLLLRNAEKLCTALLPRDGRLPDPGAADSPHRAMLLAAAEEGAPAFRAVAACFLLRAPSPDIVVRLIAQTRLMLQRPALLDVVEEVIASLAHELAGLPAGSPGQLAALTERRSQVALRLAMILSELSGQGLRLEALAAEAGQTLARQFGTTLETAVLAPLESLGSHAPAGTDRLAAIESAARAAKRMQIAGRTMGRDGMFAAPIAAARHRITTMARQTSALADAEGRVALPDLVRLVEILAGPEEALAMVEQLASEA